MVTLLLAETKPGLERTLEEVENMCHSVGMGVIVHHEDEDLDDLLDCVEGKVIVFSPKGRLSIDKMIETYKGDVILVVGGFTEKRELDKKVFARAADTVSLGRDFLDIPTVVEKIIDAYEAKKVQ